MLRKQTYEIQQNAGILNLYLIFKAILSRLKGKSQASFIVSYFNKTIKKKHPKMESVWANTFLLDDYFVWKNIFTEKIKKNYRITF